MISIFLFINSVCRLRSIGMTPENAHRLLVKISDELDDLVKDGPVDVEANWGGQTFPLGHFEAAA